MKKILMALAIASLGTVAASAQTTQIETPSKYTVATNSFWSNWYIQLGVDASVQIPYGTGDFFNQNWHLGRTYGLDLAVGKWFTPGIGTRLKLNWENGAFAHAFRNTDHVLFTPDFHDGGYAALYFDTEFNLSNLLCGYNESRVWNLSVYPRLGVIRNFETNKYAAAIGGGFTSTWKVSKHLSIYLDAALVSTTDKYLPYYQEPSACASNLIASADFGVQFNLGSSTWSKAVPLEAYNALAAASEEALAKLRAELDKERAENARLRALLAEQKPANTSSKVEKVVAAAKTSVFFDLNSAKLNSQKDLVNLEAVAAAAKESGAKVVVTGSADSKTGSDAWNQKLSEGRANAVADELVRLGVNRDNITVKAIGGVNEVTPFTLNRRAVVELK